MTSDDVINREKLKFRIFDKLSISVQKLHISVQKLHIFGAKIMPREKKKREKVKKKEKNTVGTQIREKKNKNKKYILLAMGPVVILADSPLARVGPRVQGRRVDHTAVSRVSTWRHQPQVRA